MTTSLLAASEMPLPIGSRIGSYDIRALLGVGGMGEVYDAYDTRLQRRVAIKVVAAAGVTSGEQRERFEREARLLAALSHPNIVTIHGIEECNEQLLLVMERIDGRPLTDGLPSTGVSLDALLELSLPLAEAVIAAHAKGITHRDLKPGNILVTPDRQVKVLDFGLAKLGEPRPTSTDPTVLAPRDLTVAGTITGTLAYMSPEQAEGAAVDHRSDVFSLGVILYELATGTRPFTGASTATIMSSLLRDTPPLVTQQRPDLPAALAVLVRRCLEKDRDRRVQTALDVRNALLELRAPPPSAPTAVPASRLSRTGRRIGVGALLALAVGAAGWWGFARRLDSGRSIDSIAVLPFVNISGNAEIDYVASGLTETLTNSLSTLPNVRVVARSRAARYRGASVDPVQAGRDLRVRAVVTGQVSRRGDALQVTIDLTDVVSDAHLWGEPFERPVSDALGLQKSLGTAIAARVRQRLTKEEVAGLTAGTEDAVAYELYLKGQDEFVKRTAGSLARATTLFEDATARDPRYVSAWVGLSRVYGTRVHTEQLAPEVGYPKAAAAANTAIALHERSASAHAALGVALLLHQWNWTEAEREFRRAKTLEPDNAEVLFLYGAFFLRYADRPEEALAELERAEALDPVTAAVPAHRAMVLARNLRYDQAIAAAQLAVSLAPESGLAQRHLALVYRVAHRCPEAVVSSERLVQVGNARGPLFLAAALATCGREVEARALLRQHEVGAASATPAPLLIAAVHAALGSNDRALAWLERGLRERDSALVGLAAAPEFAALAGEPRFQALRERIGIPSN